ncbi:MAG: Holliday junction resolvase RuvX [Propionibacteriaceae bacterium]|jgi:putative Holliday junction resolvase|nr:Holliday junction resolvase RuvX [Propionibacteriaceae bacterium]
MLPRGALLAVDVGTVRIGVAACGAERILAYPVTTLAADQDWVGAIVGLADEHAAQAVVVGYPLALNGSASIAAEKVRAQAVQLARRLPVPVWLVDERMTTAQAHRRLRESGRHAKTARGVIDAQAAVGILESVLRAEEQGRATGIKLQMEETDG